MQKPEGKLESFDEKKLAELESAAREQATGKPHPVFEVGEILTLKGGKWKVSRISTTRMYLDAVPY